MYAQGIGRHSQAEQREMGVTGMRAILAILGDKKYLMGDTPCDEDSCLFGSLCWVMYNIPEKNFYNGELRKLPNLVAYVERMRDEFWKDWDDVKYKPGK